MAIPAVAPVYDGDSQLVGVLGNNFFLSQINDFLGQLEIGETGETFILERSGLLVATSTEAQSFRLEAGRPQRIEATTSEEPLIAATATHLLERYGSFDTMEQETQLSFSFQGQRHFLQVTPFQNGQGLDWLIVVAVPESDFMGQIQANTRQTIWLCLGAVILASGSGVLTSRWLMRPILNLAKAAQAIAQGHLTQQVPPSRLQELEILGIAFNQMSQRLAQSFRDLKRYQQELQVSNQELQSQADLFRLIADNMGDLVCLHDLEGRYLYVSPSAEWILGYLPEALLKQDAYGLFHPEDCDRIRTEAHQPALRGSSTTITYRIRHQSGQYIWLESITRPIKDQAGGVVQLQTTSRDVSEKVRLRQKLEHDALHDALTGLPNRNRLINRLGAALARSHHQPNYLFAVVFLDLDHFKNINDSLGHLMGDQMLIAITHRLINALGSSNNLAARFGGDEFILLLDPISSVPAARQFTEQIIATLRAPITLGDQDVFVTVSAGLVISSGQYMHPSELIRDADIAMFQAKAAGRNQIQVFNSSMHTGLMERVHLEHDLRKALADHPEEFVLYYQPIVNLHGIRAKGFEALVRWQHPTRGLLAPDKFIPLAEETGLIEPLGLWILESACQQVQTWCQQFQSEDLTISVNLSVAQLRNPNLLEQIDSILKRLNLAGHHLTLEITESMLIEDAVTTLSLLSSLRQRHIQLSIDDFGTGYSSLSYLYSLPLQTLKIDRTFIQQMDTSLKHRKIVQAIIQLAHQLEFATVAEGIENVHHLSLLKTFNCDFGQGYWFSKPQTASEATRWLSLNRSLPVSSRLAD